MNTSLTFVFLLFKNSISYSFSSQSGKGMERKYKESPLLVPYKREMHDVIIKIVCSKCVCLPQTVFGFILLLNIVTLKSILVWQLEASLIFYVVENCKINYI